MDDKIKYKQGPQYDRAPSEKNYSNQNKKNFFQKMYNVLFFDYCKIKWKRLIRTIWVLYIIIFPFGFNENWIYMIERESPVILLLIPLISIPFFLFSYVLKPFIVKMD